MHGPNGCDKSLVLPETIPNSLTLVPIGGTMEFTRCEAIGVEKKLAPIGGTMEFTRWETIWNQQKW